uniref:Chalcone isomerase domain-containing protein n=1 Tax=Tetraselmis chuii TaxID=63592 RepID=A0A7S1SL99_9CHLO|mmetsp:Transcript_16851/g.30045  ORF Transcript_16851/g.30045 Transcript_16851/m.30045 type:complete len:273 (+) Transcript_16851:214-1032(+)
MAALHSAVPSIALAAPTTRRLTPRPNSPKYRVLTLKYGFTNTSTIRAGREAPPHRHSAHNLSRVAVLATVTDPATKLSFPDVVDGLTCLGAGVREKKVAFVGVKVYSVALYVDEAAASVALQGGSGLMDARVEKMLSIKMARKVDGPTFWEALNEAVLPRIAQIATNQATAEDEEGNFMADVAEAAEVKEEAAQDAAEELGAFLQTATLEKGTEVTLRCSPDGELHVAVDGGDGKTFASAELCEAIFDIYLGDDPISPTAYSAFMAAARSLT